MSTSHHSAYPLKTLSAEGSGEGAGRPALNNIDNSAVENDHDDQTGENNSNKNMDQEEPHGESLVRSDTDPDFVSPSPKKCWTDRNKFSFPKMAIASIRHGASPAAAADIFNCGLDDLGLLTEEYKVDQMKLCRERKKWARVEADHQ